MESENPLILRIEAARQSSDPPREELPVGLTFPRKKTGPHSPPRSGPVIYLPQEKLQTYAKRRRLMAAMAVMPPINNRAVDGSGITA